MSVCFGRPTVRGHGKYIARNSFYNNFKHVSEDPWPARWLTACVYVCVCVCVRVCVHRAFRSRWLGGMHLIPQSSPSGSLRKEPFLEKKPCYGNTIVHLITLFKFYSLPLPPLFYCSNDCIRTANIIASENVSLLTIDKEWVENAANCCDQVVMDTFCVCL